MSNESNEQTARIREEVESLCRRAKSAAPILATSEGALRNAALSAIADALDASHAAILDANREDLAAAKENGIPDAMLDRLSLTDKRLFAMSASVRALAALPDPLGSGDVFTRPNGLVISRVRVPLGVVGMIYESRPNVTVDAATICLKAGCAAVLRGGKEAIHSNRVLADLMRNAIHTVGIPPDAVNLVTVTDRASAECMMQARGLLDVLIPRGGKNLIRSVTDNARVPVIETGAGNCHLYVDASANLAEAVRVAVNAKCQRPAVCNAIETLLVHESVAGKFLPAFADAVKGRFPLELRGDEKTRAILPRVLPVTEEDYATEFDDYVLAVRVVSSVGEAIAHIRKYTTGHSEAILTNDMAAAHRFQNEIDAACIYVNASTRFTDGGEFGFGAEIGISTQKLHARGPMGLDALTTVKYLISGNGQIRE